MRRHKIKSEACVSKTGFVEFQPLIRISVANPSPATNKPSAKAEGFFIMNYVVYILYSAKSDRNYTGYTTHLIQRILSHNSYGTDSTAKYRPWVVIHVEFYATKGEALKKEKYYKSGRGSIKKNEIINQYLARWAHTLP
jgi:putative endonuclease